MDKEDFYDMMYACCALFKEDYDSKFEGVVDVLDFPEEMKEQFIEMIKYKG